jgi:hypothetical protein
MRSSMTKKSGFLERRYSSFLKVPTVSAPHARPRCCLADALQCSDLTADQSEFVNGIARSDRNNECLVLSPVNLIDLFQDTMDTISFSSSNWEGLFSLAISADENES